MSKNKSIGSRLLRIFGGYEIAVVCLFLLFLLTFFGTIEQQWIGLYQTIKKYFDLDSFFVIPQLSNGKYIPLPLPGAYWVMVVLFVNMFIGGVVRARKGWRKVGTLISHFSILFMLLAGGVSSISKREGSMLVYEGQTSDFAQSLFEPSIEIFQYGDDGSRGNPLVIDETHLRPMKVDDTLDADLEGMPFSVEVSGVRLASQMKRFSQGKVKDDGGKVVDGFYLSEVEPDLLEERNLVGCYLTVKTNEGEKELLLWEGNPYPVSHTIDGKRYGFLLTGKVWPMPYQVELHRSVGEYYPGTRKPRWFQSDVVKVDGDNREAYEIVMNEPMRHGGYTLYQADWTPPGENGVTRSGFAIVKNPSDKWPEYALYSATIGLGIHFIMMLLKYLSASTRKSNPAQA